MSNKPRNRARKVSPAWFLQNQIEPHILITVQGPETPIANVSKQVTKGYWTSAFTYDPNGKLWTVYAFESGKDAAAVKLHQSEYVTDCAKKHKELRFFTECYLWKVWAVDLNAEGNDVEIHRQGTRITEHLQKGGLQGPYGMRLPYYNKYTSTGTILFTNEADAEWFYNTFPDATKLYEFKDGLLDLL